MNASLGRSVDVRDAVELLARSASPLDVFAGAARDMRWRFRHAPRIADDLLLPAGVGQALARLRGGSEREGRA